MCSLFGQGPGAVLPVGNTGPALLQIEEAKTVCRSCEVIDVCLKWAIETARTPACGVAPVKTSVALVKRRAARARRAS